MIKQRGDQFWLFGLIAGATLSLWKLNSSSSRIERTEKMIKSLQMGKSNVLGKPETSEEELKVMKT